MSRYTLGLDFGGGGGRALLLDLETGATHLAARSWAFVSAPDTGGLGVDVDLARSWALLGEASREVLARAGAAPRDVAAVAATAMRLGNVILDASGDALLAVPNRDARAAGPGIMLAIEHGEAIQADMGRWPYPIHTAARLQWWRQNRPGLAERTACVLSLSDWIAFRLCGERASDPSQAAETLLFELASRSWSSHWADTLGIDAGWLPRVVESGAQLGELSAASADHLGLAHGTPVAVGGADTQCALLGAGASRPGLAGIVAGTTAPVQVITARPLIDPEIRVWSSQHLAPGRFVLESNGGPMGEVLEWMSAVLHPAADRPVPRLLEEASRCAAGALGLLSSLGASVQNDRAMGLPAGHLTLSHLVTGRETRPGRAVARALVEGMACGLRANLEQAESLAGPSEGPLHLSGGLSRSRFFATLLAGVLGRPVSCSTQSAGSAVGAALCAAVAVGRFAHLDEAAASRSVHAEVVEPEPDDLQTLAQAYARWSRWRASGAELDRVTAELTLPFALAGQQAATTGGTREV